MATLDIMLGAIIAPKVDVQPIKEAFRIRGMALGSQMPADAAAQLQSDINAYNISVTGEGSSVVFNVQTNETYLTEYLESHGTPVSGGDGGTAHNLDGSTYPSMVPKQLQGTPLPWYELPVIEIESEINHIAEIMAPDAVENAANNSHEEITEAATPVIAKEVQNMLGGG